MEAQTIAREAPSSTSVLAARAVAIGFVGPRELSSDATAWAQAEIELELEKIPTSIRTRRMLSALSSPLDHAIVEHALQNGFSLEAVLPSKDYETSLGRAARDSFTALVARASDWTRLTHETPSVEALEAAARFIIYYSDVFIIVLDENESKRPDRGTAIAMHARDQRRKNIVIDPKSKRIERFL